MEDRVSLVPLIEQVRVLPWATIDDLLAAVEDVYARGTIRAELVNVDGDLRFERLAPTLLGPYGRTGRRRRDP